MSQGIPADHALRRLFRGAVDRAFTCHRELYAPDVASHLSDSLLADFVHMDAVYRLCSADGQRLEDLPEMLQVSVQPEGPERRLEVDRYIGDFTLFMLGFFPRALHLHHLFAPKPMISRVGKLLVQFEQTTDFYSAEGRNAYGRAAETARLFDPQARQTFSQLADRYDGYRELMTTVKEILADTPQVKEIENALDDGAGGDVD